MDKRAKHSSFEILEYFTLKDTSVIIFESNCETTE